MNWKKNLLSFLLGLSGVFMKAQTPVSFTSDQGLSNTCIRSIMEDSRKNVWISTQSGLNRYDGVKMNVYRHKKGEAGTLGHDMVSCALEVEPGSVLVGMESGVQMYSYDTDRFTDVPIIVVGGDTIHAHVISMTKLSGDSIYVCTAGYGLYRLCEDEDGKKFLKEMRDFPPAKVTLLQIFEDREKRVWFVDADGGNIVQRVENSVGWQAIPGLSNFVRVRPGIFIWPRLMTGYCVIPKKKIVFMMFFRKAAVT